MQDNQNPMPKSSKTRQEKLSLLSALLGPEALAKLNSDHEKVPDGSSQSMADLDPKRAEWHRNRLMERFRLNANETATGAGPGIGGRASDQQDGTLFVGGKPTGIDHRLRQAGSPADLAREHPAVIAHILSKLPRAERIERLKSLPGPVARAVVRRIR